MKTDYMKKILLRKITALLVIVGLIEIIIFSIISYTAKHNDTTKHLNEMLSQFEISYRKNETNINEKIELYTIDYLNRTYAINFIISNNQSLQTVEGLKKLQHLMNVSSIHLVDKQGVIVISTEESSIGLNLLEYESSKEFWNIIRGTSSGGYAISLETVSIGTEKVVNYIGVTSSIPDYSMIQIGVDKSVIDDLLSTTTLSYLLEHTPTVFSESILAVDSSNGEILAMTKNNEQKFDVSGISSNEELLEVLQNASNGCILKINGSYHFVKTMLVDNILLVATNSCTSFFTELLFQIGLIGVTIVVIILILIILLKIFLKKYVLNDINSISKNIEELNSGSNNVVFEDAATPEMQSLSNLLNGWRNSYQYKDQRISRIITSLDSHIAIFECIYSINSNYFSNNMQSVLGISDLKWSKISSSPASFEQYIDKLLAQQSEDKLIEINNRILMITPFKSSNEFYGLILDKTLEINTLRATQQTASTDQLTGLLNRNAFETLTINSLSKNPDSGILLIFDLDNFKTINDTLGHPEGDKVLQQFANCLRSNFRKNDIIGRLGGDEFIVFIDANLPYEMLKSKLDFLLEQIRKSLKYYYDNYNVSTSIGASYVDNRTYTYEELYKCADTALYIAKDLGKDRYFFNADNIRCMRGKCINCTKDCKKKALLFDPQKKNNLDGNTN